MYSRALAALGEEYIISWVEAFHDCCKHKKSSIQCILYRLNAVDLITLACDVAIRQYSPSVSITFIVVHPRLREIFAAHFRDRIVQHWIVLRIEPLLEARFISQGDVSFNCRKGYGTLAAVNRLEQMMIEVSQNYSIPAYVGRFDISSFFMSIDVRILWQQLEPFIKEYYSGDDIETLYYLMRITIFHRPQDKCERRGDIRLWDYLEKSKSLFSSLMFIGMAIGNITSQLLANFFLSFFDAFIIELCRKHEARYIRFVDDFTVVAKSTAVIKLIENQARRWLAENLNLVMHKRKVYIQEVRHGVKFVGTVIKPGRKYLSNGTWGKFYDALKRLEEICADISLNGENENNAFRLDKQLESINSYLGFAHHNSSYKILRKSFYSLNYFWKVCYPTNHFLKVKIKKPYKLCEYLYGTHLQSRAATPQGGRPHRKSGNKNHSHQLRCQGGKRQRAGQVLLPPGGDVSLSDEPLGHHLRSHQSQV